MLYDCNSKNRVGHCYEIFTFELQLVASGSEGGYRLSEGQWPPRPEVLGRPFTLAIGSAPSDEMVNALAACPLSHMANH